MKLRNILIPLYTAVLSYCALLFVLGPGGILRMRELETRKAVIESNLGELQSMNREYERRMDLLIGDEETILLSARKLGYVQEGEKTMRLDISQSHDAFGTKGKFVKLVEPEWPFGFLLPVCAIVVFVITRSFMLLLYSGRREHDVFRRRTI